LSGPRPLLEMKVVRLKTITIKYTYICIKLNMYTLPIESVTNEIGPFA
jgi:hypothetical protein